MKFSTSPIRTLISVVFFILVPLDAMAIPRSPSVAAYANFGGDSLLNLGERLQSGMPLGDFLYDDLIGQANQERTYAELFGVALESISSYYLGSIEMQDLVREALLKYLSTHVGGQDLNYLKKRILTFKKLGLIEAATDFEQIKGHLKRKEYKITKRYSLDLFVTHGVSAWEQEIMWKHLDRNQKNDGGCENLLK